MQFLFSITWGSVSGWWAPACLALGIVYAWLLYRKPAGIDRRFRPLLSVFRAVVVAVIALLLLSPLVKSVSYNSQKPLVLVTEDNSQSVKMFSKDDLGVVVNDLSSLKKQLGADYDVREFHFNRNVADGLTKDFSGKQTDIANALKQLNDRFVNQNIGAVILATDGLYNQGSDPQYEAKNIKAPVYTVAEGDTVAKRDLLIGNVNYNKTAFLGDDFVIEVLAEAYQAKGEAMRLSVAEDGRQVASQSVNINSNDFHQVVPLKLHADKKGARKFTISITPVQNELSTQNNTETIYVDVLDAKQKILLLYEGPHPDISVIRQSIESNKNYEVKATLLSQLTSVKPGDYSLVILYQCTAAGNNILQNFLTAKVPVWYILGAQSNLQAFDQDQKLLQISAGQDQMQEVFAQPTADFTDFTLSDSSRRKIAMFPPLLAPYGTYSTPPPGSTLLKQKIGSVETSYPLLTFADEGGQRMGMLAGEGLWRWQLAEYEAFGNHHALEELFSQGVQYLTANANRQRFIVYPSKRVFDEGENVLLNAELYNDALELVNTPDVKIEFKNDAGKRYSFLFTRNNQSYQLDAGTLPVGEYSYTAATKLGDKPFATAGQLSIKPLNLEIRQSAANHQLLNTIAKQSGGQMLYPGQISRLAGLIRKNENIKTVVYEDKLFNEIIDAKWVFALIVLLLSAEWFLRKREGSV
jgi:hypothetical protein